MVERAEKVATGTRPVKKDRLVKVDGASKGVNWALVERACQLAGLSGYMTNVEPEVMSGAQVISAYHDLWQVETSFRMVKSDRRAHPILHHQRDSIEAHLTIVLAALAGQHLTLEPKVPPGAQDILTALPEMVTKASGTSQDRVKRPTFHGHSYVRHGQTFAGIVT